jgi:hypothetical protein
MSDLVTEARQLRDALTRAHNALFADGEPLPGTGDARRRLRRLLERARRRVVRRLVHQWRAKVYER